MSYRVEPDGTRVYDKGMRYKPKALHERKYAVRKPADPRAVRFGGHWYGPLDVLPDGQRSMPRTRPDGEGFAHRLMCQCDVCEDNPALLWLKKVELGLRPEWSGPGPAPRYRRALLLQDAGTAD